MTTRIQRFNRRFLTSIVIGTGVLTCALGAAAAAGVSVNLTKSMPRGLYLPTVRDPQPEDVLYGSIVSFCPPKAIAVVVLRNRGYLPPGRCEVSFTQSGRRYVAGKIVPLMKIVIGEPGDVVDIAEASMTLTRRDGSTHTMMIPLRDGIGRAVPSIPQGRYIIPQGSVWVTGDNDPYSLDSRYYGPVPVASMEAAYRPFLVEKH